MIHRESEESSLLAALSLFGEVPRSRALSNPRSVRQRLRYICFFSGGIALDRRSVGADAQHGHSKRRGRTLWSRHDPDRALAVAALGVRAQRTGRSRGGPVLLVL